MSIKIGIDIGSTTTKIAVMDNGDFIYQKYIRHLSRQKQSVLDLLQEIKDTVSNSKIQICFTGSGSKVLADKVEMPYTQEVIANSLAIKKMYKDVSTAIELGGQDAKIIFFRKDDNGETKVFDMRMNGSCAGGTGAFIDEIALVLGIDEQEINDYASKGNSLYDISGRCGVFAKTDIQPLLNQGAKKEDIALSSFHAIAKQTIGGLAQGLDILTPIIFEGGPLTFNPKLIDVFVERLGIKSQDVIVPKHPEMMVAYGASFSIDSLHSDSKEYDINEIIQILNNINDETDLNTKGQLFFESIDEKERFVNDNMSSTIESYVPKDGEVINAYLGIDAGSTTTKFVLINDNEEIIDSFYASNEGNPLIVGKNALLEMYEKYKNAKLNIIASATTGYGEYMFNKAFKTETHLIETVAHSIVANKYCDNPSFILDIGGQDMKAIWLNNGIITNIVVNEACSSGCGSFLENFAKTLGIDTKDIASKAFNSKNPAVLGSRCTVFMNSSVITELREGKTEDDIVAGLCRSIIENVFTKVIRISNIDNLGDKIVVQGGTFENDAVLRAMQQYLNKPIKRAPYAKLMGAIGAAMYAKEYSKSDDYKPSFIDYDSLKNFTYSQSDKSICPYCTNHCNRTILKFSTGETFVGNNRCEKGEIIDDPNTSQAINKLNKINSKDKPINMFDIREELLFKDYECKKLIDNQNITIGIPRVLEFYESMPFWRTFFKSLGYKVIVSGKSTRRIYEEGLRAVASDTECFPAKLVHGHIRELVKQKVDYIFFPSISIAPPDNTEKTSFSRCALVKGYPIVINNSDSPEKQFNTKMLAPYFFFFTEKDREKQLSEYMHEQFGIAKSICLKAIRNADKVQKDYEHSLKTIGKEVIDSVTKENKYAIVIAARPYHNDSLVNHELPNLFINMGIPVLTVDSLPNIEKLDLSKSRLDIVNNYHARVVSGSMYVASNPNLELVQIVSFGCGHDAILSDEAIRIMKEEGGCAPLIVKVDESDAQGPIRIRVRSFIDTIERKRRLDKQNNIKKLSDPYKVKFNKNNKDMTLLVPNSSHAFSKVMATALSMQGVNFVSIDVGREEAIRLGKKYTHNDVCFPAQIVIGELLQELNTNKYEKGKVGVAMAKYICCCRLTHYVAILRKALDDAGYDYVPIATTDTTDYHNIHPGFKMSLYTIAKVSVALGIVDVFEEALRKIRPYEKIKGSSDKAFDDALEILLDGIKKRGFIRELLTVRKGLNRFRRVEYDKTIKKPKVLIVGEYLMNFHVGANHEIERYLEKNGFEVIEARMMDVVTKFYFAASMQQKEYKVDRPLVDRIVNRIINFYSYMTGKLINIIAPVDELHDSYLGIKDMAKKSNDIIYQTFDTGEGILIPAEIIHNAEKGCRNFIVLQPFGCLPNHVVGRGIAKKIKEMYPDCEFLALDYDPDLSFANIENRLQMMVMSQSKQ